MVERLGREVEGAWTWVERMVWSQRGKRKRYDGARKKWLLYGKAKATPKGLSLVSEMKDTF